MATYNNTVGVMSFGQTTSANVADTITFVDRFGFIQVYNESNTNAIYVRADGVAASDAAGETGSLAVPPNAYVIIANGLPLWKQTAKVIRAGTTQIPQGSGYMSATSATNTGNPANPGEMTPYQAGPTGGTANPGTSISVISTGAVSYVIAAAG